jgi:hypothetical protein
LPIGHGHALVRGAQPFALHADPLSGISNNRSSLRVDLIFAKPNGVPGNLQDIKVVLIFQLRSNLLPSIGLSDVTVVKIGASIFDLSEQGP